MGTTIRPELSSKNRYWIDRHRYYELKHFCLQYPSWKAAYAAALKLSYKPLYFDTIDSGRHVGNPTERQAELRVFYSNRIEMVEHVAKDTDQVLAKYILAAVTEGLSYDVLKARLDIPCCKDMYYDRYRRFFWLLSKARQ